MPKPKQGEGIPPVTIPFFSTGYFTRRSPLFAPFKSLGVNIVSYHDALIDGQDMEVTDLLEIQRRPGYSPFCSATLGAGELILQWYSFRSLEGVVLPFFDSNQRWAQFSSSAITTLLTKTTTHQGFPFTVGDKTYYTDGVDFVKLDQFGNVTPWGIAAPTAPPTIAGMGFWQPATAFAFESAIVDLNGNVEFVTSGPFTSGNIEPLWATTVGGITRDGFGLQWTNLGPSGIWSPFTTYLISAPIVDSNGNFQVVTAFTSASAWNVSTTYVQGDYVSYGGAYYICTVGNTALPPGSVGTTTPYWTAVPNPTQTGATAPTWATAQGATTVDGSFTWTNAGPGYGIAQAGYTYVYAIRTIYGDLSTSSPPSIDTGPIVGPQPANITSWAILTGVITFQGSNNFQVGDTFTVTGLVVGGFLNGLVFTVISAGLSPTQFSSNVVVSGGPATEGGHAVPQIAAVTGPGVANPLCNSVALITSISITDNIVTATSNNSFVAGLFVNLFGIGTATFLAPGPVNQYQILYANATMFKFEFMHSDYANTPDTGSATFQAIEIYRVADGGGIYYAAGAVVNPGAGFNWTFNDFVPDSGLFTEEIAPLAHSNDPPPNAPGSTYPGTGPGVVHGLAWWQGRLWLAIDNYVFFSAGPDCLNGDPYSTFPPTYTFKFPGPVLGIAATDNGIMVWLADRCALILGGPQTATFYNWDFLKHTGVSSPNCIAQDGQAVWVYTTQAQLRKFDGGQDANEGVYIADVLMSAFPPATSYLTVHRNGLDEGMFISNGTDTVLRLGVNIPCWSVPAKPVGGAVALRSIETSVGVHSLMLGQP